MRWLSSALLLALLAAFTALFLRINVGNVALFVPPYRIDVSVNLALLALVLLLSAVYWVARVVQKMADFPEQVRLYRARREEIGANRALVESVKNFSRADSRAPKICARCAVIELDCGYGSVGRGARGASDAGILAARRVARPCRARCRHRNGAARGECRDADRATRERCGTVCDQSVAG